jgi:hypothetical protein
LRKLFQPATDFVETKTKALDLPAELMQLFELLIVHDNCYTPCS